MLNQINSTTLEAAQSSGLFLKNYLDYIEDFPGKIQLSAISRNEKLTCFAFLDDIARIFSICREIDIETNSNPLNSNLNPASYTFHP